MTSSASPHAAPASTGTLDVPGARLHYELRGAGPLIALVGAPMNATSFAPLAELLASDHRVLTADPRGISRSPVEDPEQGSTPELRADDLARLIRHVDAGPATVFGSSGGAVSALALLQAHPAEVRAVVAHEPPLDELLDDRERLHAETDDIIATYLAGDRMQAWARFMRQADIDLPEGALEQMFGGEQEPQAAADERRWFAHELRATTRWQPDLAVLRAVSSQVVVAIGEQSAGQLCDRAARALAAALGSEPATFPGGHTGFVDHPGRFAAALRAVLDRP